MAFLQIIWQSLSITLFVISMMLVIEYFNVLTRGTWGMHLQSSRWKQVLLGGILGIIPGCLGAYTAVSLYVHNLIGTGALVAAMIATSGDEAFFMFAIMPRTAVILSIVLFATGIIFGFLVDLFLKRNNTAQPVKHFSIHHEEKDSVSFERKKIIGQLRNISQLRLILLILLIISIALVSINFGHLLHGLGEYENHEPTDHHIHPNWIGATIVIVLLFSIFVVATVSDHFLEEHLINHIVKKHLLKVFLWTLGTLLALYFLKQYLSLEEMISQNLGIVLLLAVLIGVIPESGPHLVFVLLFVSGDIPFSILLANSIVQDGHGSLPLLAESRKSFLKVKIINIAAGLLAGGIAMISGI